MHLEVLGLLKMLLLASLLLLSLVDAIGTDDDLIRSSKSPQIPPSYPIGTVTGSFARTRGRLFEIDGRVGYFPGEMTPTCSSREDGDIDMTQVQMLGG
jgi:mannan endo-1,4-beta-mannosidase